MGLFLFFPCPVISVGDQEVCEPSGGPAAYHIWRTMTGAQGSAKAHISPGYQIGDGKNFLQLFRHRGMPSTAF